MVVFNDPHIHLETRFDDKIPDHLLDSGASHNSLALNWCKENMLKIENCNYFNI